MLLHESPMMPSVTTKYQQEGLPTWSPCCAHDKLFCQYTHVTNQSERNTMQNTQQQQALQQKTFRCFTDRRCRYCVEATASPLMTFTDGR